MTRPFAPRLRMASHVQRWGVTRTIQRQSIAEHMFNVAHYAKDIAAIIGWSRDIAGLLYYALSHDKEETITGDMPGPVKRSFGPICMDFVDNMMSDEYGNYSVNVWPDDIKGIVKIADRTDEIMFGAIEWQLGNQVSGNRIMQNGTEMLYDAVMACIEWIPPGTSSSILSAVEKERLNAMLEYSGVPNV